MAYRIIGIDHGSKEGLVKECGAEVFLDITKFDNQTLPAEVKKATGGLGASAVIVCTAANGAYAQALSFLRFGGTLVCVGIPEGEHKAIANAFPGQIVSVTSGYTCPSYPNHPWNLFCKTFEVNTLGILGNTRMGHQRVSSRKPARGFGGSRHGCSWYCKDSCTSRGNGQANRRL